MLPRFFETLPTGFLRGVFMLVMVLVCLLIIFMVITPVTPKGILVSIAKPVMPTLDPPERLVIVSVRPVRGAAAEVRLNSNPVAWGRLQDALREELRYHVRHIVFVEGGGELEYVEVARAVDIAHGASPRVTVVLLTPKLKKAMQIQ